MKAGSVPSMSPKFPLAVLGLAMLGGLAVGPRLFREQRALDGELAVLRAAQSSTVVKGARPPTGENAQLSPEYEHETALLRAAEAKAMLRPPSPRAS